MAGDAAEPIPFPLQDLATMPERPIAPNFGPFSLAMDNAELPSDMRLQLESSIPDRYARALLHGRVHLLASEGKIPPVIEIVLLSGLQASADQNDVDSASTLGKKPHLIENNMEPWKDCKEVCWGDMPPKDREAYMQKNLAEEAGVQRDIVQAEQYIQDAITNGLGVKDAAKKYGNDLLFLASLASDIDDLKPGWKGLRELLDICPPVEGFGDPFKTLRGFIEAYDRGEIPESVHPVEWIDKQAGSSRSEHYFYIKPKKQK